MKKILRFFSIFLFAILFIGIPGIAEEITLTTYYPAPYGAYDALNVKDGLVIGATYLEDEDTAPSNGMIVEGMVGIGITEPTGALHLKTNALHSYLSITGRDTGDTANDGLRIGVSSTTGRIILKENANLEFHTNDRHRMTIEAGGDVGIGLTDPSAKLHVAGNIKATLNDIDGAPMKYNEESGEIGLDIAELFNATEEVEVGDLLVLDETKDLQLRKSLIPYEKGIVGVVSGSPAILFEGSQLEIAPTPGGFKKGIKPPIALAGRIKCKVSIENGPIGRGDLLTSSSTPGHAMKAVDREKSFGAIVGKALEPFDGGPDDGETGEIIILVTIQ